MSLPAIGWAERVAFALDAAKGIAHLHAHGVIHRDIKSSNLLLGEAPAPAPAVAAAEEEEEKEIQERRWRQRQRASPFVVKVGDFGLSCLQREHGAKMTRCGTPSWTAPEVMVGAHYNRSADLFGFGVVMWELVTAAEPYAGIEAGAGGGGGGGAAEAAAAAAAAAGGGDGGARSSSSSSSSSSSQGGGGGGGGTIDVVRLMMSIVREQLRPEPPPWLLWAAEDDEASVERQWLDLMVACWQHDPAARPTSEAAVARLERMTAQLEQELA